nr:protein STPG3 isoform X1 [Anser cygnoides]
MRGPVWGLQHPSSIRRAGGAQPSQNTAVRSPTGKGLPTGSPAMESHQQMIRYLASYCRSEWQPTFHAQLCADHYSGKRPWRQSTDPVIGKMDLKYGANPVCNICSPQVAGAMYPHFIREQRTKLDLLRNRKYVGQPRFLHPHILPPATASPLLNCQPSLSPKILAPPLLLLPIPLLPTSSM